MTPESWLLLLVAALMAGGFALIYTGTRIEATAVRATKETDATHDGGRDGDPALSTQNL